MVGTYEYPDFPMSVGTYAVQPYEHIPAATLHRYLTDYAQHFGVFDKIQFDTKVDLIEYEASGTWKLSVTKDEKSKNVRTEKLIVATHASMGLT